MLHNSIKHYPVYGLSTMLCTLPAGESFDFPAGGSKDCIGTIYLSGVLSAAEDAWRPIPEHFDWRPRGAWGGWNDPNALPDAKLTLHAGDVDARWLCALGARLIEPHAMAGELIVPAGTPFIVGSDATVSFGGKDRGVATLFGPRDIDTKAFGNATLLFVR